MNIRPKRGPRDAAFQAIQRRWDKRLRRSGFVDIEGGLDLNLTDDWTFRGGDAAKGGHVSCEELTYITRQAGRSSSMGRFNGASVCDLGKADGLSSIAVSTMGNTARYAYWTIARHAAYAMGEGEPNRDLFIAIAEAGNVQTVAKDFGMGRERARRVWGAFLWRIGIGKRRVS